MNQLTTYATSLIAAGLVAFASAQVPIEQAFIASVAERMSLQDVRCDSTTSEIATLTGSAAYCYQHDFASFREFVAAWDESAEWEGVFFLDTDVVSGFNTLSPDGRWVWMSEDTRQAGVPLDFETYMSTFILDAKGYGFSGALTVTLVFGQDNLGQSDHLEIFVGED